MNKNIQRNVNNLPNMVQNNMTQPQNLNVKRSVMKTRNVQVPVQQVAPVQSQQGGVLQPQQMQQVTQNISNQVVPNNEVNVSVANNDYMSILGLSIKKKYFYGLLFTILAAILLYFWYKIRQSANKKENEDEENSTNEKQESNNENNVVNASNGSQPSLKDLELKQK